MDLRGVSSLINADVKNVVHIYRPPLAIHK